MATIRVGEDKDFTTITAALDSASDGDLILVDPGDYSAENVLVVHNRVNIVGDTKQVLTNYVKVPRISYNLTTSVDNPFSILVLENLFIRNDSTAASLTYSTGDIVSVCNRCYIHQEGTYYVVLPYDDVLFIWFTNCHFYRYSNSNTAKIGAIRTLMETNNGGLAYSDYVTIPTPGYGLDYGYSYFKLPSKYYFSGKVTVSGVPAERELRAYNRSTDSIMSYTKSDPITGSYKLITEYDGEHYLICKESSGGIYNDLIRGKVWPALEDYERNVWMDSSKLVITIDHTKVDIDLYNFTLFIRISTDSGLSNKDLSYFFDELNVDAIKYRWSLQNDNNTQLYCEILKWDVSNKEALFFTTVPYVSSAEDTVLTLYFNKHLEDNTYYIGSYSSLLVSHLWSLGGAIGVWHMLDDPGTSSILDSSFRRHNAIPFNLTSTDVVDVFWGKALDFSSGYLILDSNIDSLYNNVLSVQALVKFKDFNSRGVIFCYGGFGRGCEVGIDKDKLFLCVSTSTNSHIEASISLNGLDVNDWYFISSTIDRNTGSLTLTVNDTIVVDKYIVFDDFKSTDNDYIIGSNYLSSPYDEVDQAPLYGTELFPIILTSSGTVASGTVFYLKTTVSGYQDATGRHSFIPKRTDDVSVTTQYSKFSGASLKNNLGQQDSDPYNEYNYIEITDNFEDLGFDYNQDFTISCWVFSSIHSYSVFGDVYLTIVGDASASRDSCLSIVKYYSTNYTNKYLLTIPNDSGGFVVQTTINSVFTTGWTHIALVRKSGTIYFFIDGAEVYSVEYTGVIASPQELSVTPGILSFSSDYALEYFDDNYGLLEGLEIIKGVGRWDAPFSIDAEKKATVDTFFPGQIAEVMLYNKRKLPLENNVSYRSFMDGLVTYT